MIYVHFYGNAGYEGSEYSVYRAYADNMTEPELGLESYDFAYDNARDLVFIETKGKWPWKTKVEREAYFEKAIENRFWEYCSEEEYNNNK